MRRPTTPTLGCCLFAAIASTALGCRPDEAQFEQQYTRQVCKLYRNCTSWFEDEYDDDVSVCMDDLGADFDEQALEGCTYDAGAAKDCVSALRQADCAAFEDGAWSLACAAVYACP